MNYRLIIGESQIEDLQRKLGASTWPELMQHDKLVNGCWPNLYTDFLDIQFALFDDEKLVGIGNMMHLNWQEPFEKLPDGGSDGPWKKLVRIFNKGLRQIYLLGFKY